MCVCVHVNGCVIEYTFRPLTYTYVSYINLCLLYCICIIIGVCCDCVHVCLYISISMYIYIIICVYDSVRNDHQSLAGCGFFYAVFFDNNPV